MQILHDWNYFCKNKCNWKGSTVTGEQVFATLTVEIDQYKSFLNAI